MADPKIRNLILQSQPEVYRAGGDVAARVDLQQTARQDPHAVLEVLLEDVIWRLFLEQITADEDTPALNQITSLAVQGDFELAYERTQLAFNLSRDKTLLLNRFLVAANEHLTEQGDK